MSKDDVKDVRKIVEAIYRSGSRQVLAALIRLLGDFEPAEEALHDAFAVAVEQWVRDGVPANPRTWLVVRSLNMTVSAAARHTGSHPS